jgi:hypothetical protein
VNRAHFAVRERRGVEARGVFSVLVEPEANGVRRDHDLLLGAHSTEQATGSRRLALFVDRVDHSAMAYRDELGAAQERISAAFSGSRTCEP